MSETISKQSEKVSSSAGISSLNDRLLAHGCTQRPLRLDGLSRSSLTQVAGVIYRLLDSSVSNMSNLDELSARHRTLTYERDRLEKSHDKVARANVKLEEEVESWKAKMAEMEQRLREEEEKTKGLKEELSRSKKALESGRVASRQEMKRMQMRLDKSLSQRKFSTNTSLTRSHARKVDLLHSDGPGSLGEAAKTA